MRKVVRALWDRLHSGEDGAVILVVGGAFVLVLTVVAFAVDLGLIFVEHREVRNAADNAALAAAWADCHDNNASTAADSNVSRNDYTAPDLTLTKLDQGTYQADVETIVDLIFGDLIGIDTATVSGSAVANCFYHGGSYNTIFAAGDCAGFGKPTLEIPGSIQRIYGGIHSNDNLKVPGSNNDFGPGDPAEDPFTFVSNFKDGGAGNIWDFGYPLQTGWKPMPLNRRLRDYSPGSRNASDAAAVGKYFYVDGPIDGVYIQSHGPGLYYSTGSIVLDKEVTLAVTLVSEDVVSFNASNQNLTPYVDGLLAFGGHPYEGIDSCDKFVVSMSGSNSNWTGLVFGPNALIEFAGSSNSTFTGSMVGYSVRINGSEVTIKSDPNLVPPSYSPRLLS